MSQSLMQQIISYGPTTVSDHANAVLGNIYTTGEVVDITINNATIVLHQDEQPAHALVRQGLKRRLSELYSQDSNSARSQNKRQRTESLMLGAQYPSVPSAHASSIGQEKVIAMNSGHHMQERFEHTLDLLSQPSATRDRSGPTDQNVSAVDLASRTNYAGVLQALRLAFCDGQVPASLKQKSRILDLAVPAAILAILVCRNISLEALDRALYDLRNDSLFPWAAAIAGGWFTRFFCNLAPQTGPSDLNDDCAEIYDVYGSQRKVPRAYLLHQDIFDGFLRSHYKNTSAAQLIDDKQYNITLDARDGRVVSDSELIRSAKYGWRRCFYMAVAYRVSYRKCLDCTNKLESYASPMINFQICCFCRRQYRVRYDHCQGPRRHDTSTYLLPPWRYPLFTVLNTGLGSFQNVDLNLGWRYTRTVQPLPKQKSRPKRRLLNHRYRAVATLAHLPAKPMGPPSWFRSPAPSSIGSAVPAELVSVVSNAVPDHVSVATCPSFYTDTPSSHIDARTCQTSNFDSPALWPDLGSHGYPDITQLGSEVLLNYEVSAEGVENHDQPPVTKLGADLRKNAGSLASGTQHLDKRAESSSVSDTDNYNNDEYLLGTCSACKNTFTIRNFHLHLTACILKYRRSPLWFKHRR